MSKAYRAWAEIKLNSLRNNMKRLRKLVPVSTKIMGVIKADAYGHGILHVAKTLEAEGIDYLGVATVDEGVYLRSNGVSNKILVLGFTPDKKLHSIIDYDLEQAVYDYEMGIKLSNLKQKINVHIKIDTGMNRLGFTNLTDVYKTCLLSNINIRGIFSHFASADIPCNTFTYNQFEKFKEITQKLSRDFDLQLQHISNSAAIINYPEFGLDMVRSGILLFGGYDFEPVMTFKSQIVSIKHIRLGDSVSYNRTFIAKSLTRVGVVSVGYADGYPRSLSNIGRVIVNNTSVFVIGNVCMDYMMIDLTDVDAKIGDEVVLIGDVVTAKDIADLTNTISYEVLTSIGKRVPRVIV